MSGFSIYLIVVSILGLLGTLVFIIDFNNLSWDANKHVYWGMIALISIISAVVFNNISSKLQARQNANKPKRNKN